MKPCNVLLLPGWQDSGPRHWQTLWGQRHGYRRVEQHDWERPLRGDWVTRLEEVLLTHYLAERMRANPTIARVLEKLAGVFLIGFGVKLAISK